MLKGSSRISHLAKLWWLQCAWPLAELFKLWPGSVQALYIANSIPSWTCKLPPCHAPHWLCNLRQLDLIRFVFGSVLFCYRTEKKIKYDKNNKKELTVYSFVFSFGILMVNSKTNFVVNKNRASKQRERKRRMLWCVERGEEGERTGVRNGGAKITLDLATYAYTYNLID